MSVAVKLIISGICALVPASDGKVARVSCPNITKGAIASDGTTPIAPHVPYLIINENALADPKVAATATMRMGSDGKMLVWILQSASLSLKEMPATGFKRRSGKADKTSIEYAADIARIWPKKGKVKQEYWDVARHPDKVSLRVDITAGEIYSYSVSPHLFEFKPKETPTPVTQLVTTEFGNDLTLPSATVLIHNYDKGAKYTDLAIVLKAMQAPVEVSFGNATLEQILQVGKSMSHVGMPDYDFELFYRMFNQPPKHPPIPTIKEMTGRARPPYEGCVPAACTDC